ncbi:MAG: hypothetical protein MUC36_24950 [Planctomycetes bacterium]|nr:hypothetical protein [Planctomycetota bacterium]
MSIQVDFLPPSYRARQQLLQQRRHRALLAVPVVLALFATDAVIAHRVEVAATMADHARAHAEQQEQRAEQVRQLAARLSERQREIERGVQPMQMPRLGAVIDALLVATPDTVMLQQVHCRHTPWLPLAAVTVRLAADCATDEHLQRYLSGLAASGDLPPLQCTRAFRGPTGLGFELESNEPGSSPR